MAARIARWLAVATLGVLLAPSAAAAQGCPDAQLGARGGTPATVAAAALCLANAERQAAGLAPLAAHAALRRAAIAHSREMVAKRFFDHTSPTGSTPLIRAKRAGYLRGARRFTVSENLGWGSGSLGSAKAIVASWMASPGHRANLLSPTVTEVGIGVVAGSPTGGRGATFTMKLGSRR